MIKYKAHSLKLNRTQLEGLYEFLKMVSETETDNFFATYFLMGINDLFTRRVWPKLAIKKKTYQMRFSDMDSFAIYLAFLSYGVGCLGAEWQPILEGIRDQFWKLDTTYLERLQPPDIHEDD